MREIWKAIKSNVTSSITHLDKTVVRTNREMVYGAVACTAVGVVIGILLSPKKRTTIGSHNGNNCCPPAEDEQEEDEQEEDEE